MLCLRTKPILRGHGDIEQVFTRALQPRSFFRVFNSLLECQQWLHDTITANLLKRATSAFWLHGCLWHSQATNWLQYSDLDAWAEL